MSPFRAAIAILVAVAMVTAGCGSIGTQGDGTASPTGTAAQPGTSSTVSGEALKQRAIAAMDGVQRYRVEAEESRVVEANLVRELSVGQVTRVDRPARELHVSMTQQTQGRSVESEIYLLNETLYQRHPQFVRQFSTAWISVNLSGNASRAWEARDALARQQAILEVAEPRRNGTEAIDGVDAYRLEASPDLDRLERVFAELVTGTAGSLNESTYNISDSQFTFWIAEGSDRPVRVSGHMNSTLSGPRQTIHLQQEVTFEYEYESTVSIELPDAAADAVPLAEALNGTDASS